MMFMFRLMNIQIGVNKEHCSSNGKKTKIALTGSLTMLAAGIGSLFYAGNYLYNLALNKQANKDAIFTNPSTNNQIPDKDRTDINKKGDSSNFLILFIIRMYS